MAWTPGSKSGSPPCPGMPTLSGGAWDSREPRCQGGASAGRGSSNQSRGRLRAEWSIEAWLPREARAVSGGGWWCRWPRGAGPSCVPGDGMPMVLGRGTAQPAAIGMGTAEPWLSLSLDVEATVTAIFTDEPPSSGSPSRQVEGSELAGTPAFSPHSILTWGGRSVPHAPAPPR